MFWPFRRNARKPVNTESSAFAALTDDARFVIRRMLRRRRFALSVVGFFALGIAAPTTVASLIDAVMLRPPAGVKSASRLRRIFLHLRTGDEQMLRAALAYPELVALEDSLLIGSIAGYTQSEVVAVEAGGRIDGARVSLCHVRVFRCTRRTRLGRGFARSETVPVAPASVTVVSYEFWSVGSTRTAPCWESRSGLEKPLHRRGSRRTGVSRHRPRRP